MRASICLVLALYVQGCAWIDNWHVDEWKVYYNNCEVKLKNHREGKIKCEWKV